LQIVQYKNNSSPQTINTDINIQCSWYFAYSIRYDRRV